MYGSGKWEVGIRVGRGRWMGRWGEMEVPVEIGSFKHGSCVLGRRFRG